MRVFKTLFSEDGIPKELRGIFWLKLAGINADVDEWKGIFHAIAAKPNAELD